MRDDPLNDEASHLGLDLRVGVHTGEVEVVPDDVRGIAVQCASRILALAGGGEVCVSSTTFDLLAGSSLTFEDRCQHELKRISGKRRVYALIG
jgi:class 3 adenylate cyclase